MKVLKTERSGEIRHFDLITNIEKLDFNLRTNEN